MLLMSGGTKAARRMQRSETTNKIRGARGEWQHAQDVVVIQCLTLLKCMLPAALEILK